VAADYPGRSRERRRRYSTGAVTAMATRDVSHGGRIESIAASAANSRTAAPAGPLNAPPNEIGESFAGELGAGGSVGALGGAEDGTAGAELPPTEATDTSEGGTSVTPDGGCHGIAVSAGGCDDALVCTANSGRTIETWVLDDAAPWCAGATCGRFATVWRAGWTTGGAEASTVGAGAATAAGGGGGAGGDGAVADVSGAGSAGTATVISVVTFWAAGGAVPVAGAVPAPALVLVPVGVLVPVPVVVPVPAVELVPVVVLVPVAPAPVVGSVVVAPGAPTPDVVVPVLVAVPVLVVDPSVVVVDPSVG